jgi:hypothetical protein
MFQAILIVGEEFSTRLKYLKKCNLIKKEDGTSKEIR